VDPLHGRTVVLYDPFPLWLDAVESAIGEVGLAIRGKTTNSGVVRKLVDEHKPDLLVTECVDDGAERAGGAWISELLEDHPALKIVVLSSDDEPVQRDIAFASGAAAYVLKSAYSEDILLAARQVFEPSIAFAHSAEQVVDLSSADALAACELTPREIEILQLVAEGHSNSKLARMLWVTEQTVKFHLSNIYRKLEVANRTEASRWAQLNGLLPSVTPQQAA
jgi:DNA-binding NarL/FixJ family response regulator